MGKSECRGTDPMEGPHDWFNQIAESLPNRLSVCSCSGCDALMIRKELLVVPVGQDGRESLVKDKDGDTVPPAEIGALWVTCLDADGRYLGRWQGPEQMEIEDLTSGEGAT